MRYFNKVLERKDDRGVSSPRLRPIEPNGIVKENPSFKRFFLIASGTKACCRTQHLDKYRIRMETVEQKSAMESRLDLGFPTLHYKKLSSFFQKIV